MPNPRYRQNQNPPWLKGTLAAVVVAALLATSAAQANWPVTALIPDAVSIRVPSATIGFLIDHTNYPPAEFPAVYPANEPEGGMLPVQVFSNVEGTWSLVLQVFDLISSSGTAVIPATQVMYRVNGGPWLYADGNPQIIYTHTGQTTGWLELRVEFALQLVGNEHSGAFVVSAVVSAISEAGF